MSIFFELGIIALISFLGVGVSSLAKLPIPGSVLAMIVFYLLLEAKVIKANKLGRACDFLNGNMALFFVPLNVGIMASYKLFADKAIGVVVTVLVSTFIGIICSYGGVMFVSKFMKGGKKDGIV